MQKRATKDLVFVGMQFVLFGLYLVPFFPETFITNTFVKFLFLILSIAGAGVVAFALLQLKTSLTVFPTPKSDGELIEAGLYKYIRHPIYSGILLLTIGWGVFDQSVWKIGVGFALYLLFYFKSRYEEGLLRARYAEYATYQKRTGRFLPGFRGK